MDRPVGIFIFLTFLGWPFNFSVSAFSVAPSGLSSRRWRRWTLVKLSATQATRESDVSVLQRRIEECIRRKQDPEIHLQALEACNPNSSPNTSPGFFGQWHVWYTDCPPPSNGQLGPFQGTAEQVIDQTSSESNEPQPRSYRNLLKVPPNDWLTATLDGVWTEWDGLLLDTQTLSTDITSTKDLYKTHWKVTFLQLQIALFGIPIFTKQFDADTSRVWRTTYLDDEIRIVRAGKTGRLEDEVVFYTRRTPKDI